MLSEIIRFFGYFAFFGIHPDDLIIKKKQRAIRMITLYQLRKILPADSVIQNFGLFIPFRIPVISEGQYDALDGYVSSS